MKVLITKYGLEKSRDGTKFSTGYNLVTFFRLSSSGMDPLGSLP